MHPRLPAHQAERLEKAPLLRAQALGSSPVEVMGLPSHPAAAKSTALLWLGTEVNRDLDEPKQTTNQQGQSTCY